jgi:hypothetical protein
MKIAEQFGDKRHWPLLPGRDPDRERLPGDVVPDSLGPTTAEVARWLAEAQGASADEAFDPLGKILVQYLTVAIERGELLEHVCALRRRRRTRPPGPG